MIHKVDEGEGDVLPRLLFMGDVHKVVLSWDNLFQDLDQPEV
eukprot:CAMPEP_0181439480 /NCGR_PEP_ID=MMETSP1110-20121109/22450_1 /TAXON_ID=174948 /ORGANISM="Symbiodinium sp., Strain CCMP421" /LENGTH=41 /DNA_ID= /DNA_START= /DNA_END= /DNA_ORIENTATION=